MIFLIISDAQVFQLKTGLAERTSCRYLLENKRTELVILRSDLLQQTVNAIVNGLLDFSRTERLIYFSFSSGG